VVPEAAFGFVRRSDEGGIDRGARNGQGVAQETLGQTEAWQSHIQVVEPRAGCSKRLIRVFVAPKLPAIATRKSAGAFDQFDHIVRGFEGKATVPPSTSRAAALSCGSHFVMQNDPTGHNWHDKVDKMDNAELALS
jgi:hypothetical protein